MEGPAQTIQYFIAGYSVIFLGLCGYIVSLALRWKKMKQEKVMLEKQP